MSENAPPRAMISGVLAAADTTPGQYNFTVQVRDSGSTPQTASMSFSVSLLGRANLGVSIMSLSSAVPAT